MSSESEPTYYIFQHEHCEHDPNDSINCDLHIFRLRTVDAPFTNHDAAACGPSATFSSHLALAFEHFIIILVNFFHSANERRLPGCIQSTHAYHQRQCDRLIHMMKTQSRHRQVNQTSSLRLDEGEMNTFRRNYICK